MDCIEIIKKATIASGLQFQMGHLNEMSAILNSTTEQNLEAYPCVMVLEDIRETESKGESVATLQVMIVTHSEPTLRPFDRWESEMMGKLEPLYEALKKNVSKEARLIEPINKIYRPRVSNAFTTSNNDRIVFSQFLNGLELRDFKISYLKTTC